ncbi:MAG: hypothetical protein FD152_3509 [Xanthobacteraceae bacterium]|nr:MAG: hypothetical protein FD152_3509 [Xanthobacteraceae bacterium]
MKPLAAAEGLAAKATPRQLALALAAVLASCLAIILVHAPIEAALRAMPCDGLACLRSRRPDTLLSGYGAADFRLYLDAVWAQRGRALLGLAVDLPLIAAVTASLLLGAGLAAPGLPLGDRTRRLLVIMPLAYAASDLAENALLAIAYAGMADVALLVPWASALKFGTAVASAAVSMILGLMRATT